MAELGRGELGVEGKAHYGGAYDRMRVRTCVNAWGVAGAAVAAQTTFAMLTT